MIPITDIHYNRIAKKLSETIGSSEYYNGSIEYETDEFTSSLKTTLIIYREKEVALSDAITLSARISDIVPVWWEYHLYKDGQEEITDFSWADLKQFLL